MFNGKKILSLMIAIAFTLQGCSRGVSPTEGNFNFVNGTPTSPQILNDLCVNKNGDSDNDGICNDDEIDTDPNDADSDDNDINDGDEKSWFARSGWWQTLGLAGMGVGTYFLVRDNKKNGKYWLKEPTQEDVIGGQDAVGAGVYLLPRNNNGSVTYLEAGSTQRWYSAGGTRHFIQKNISEVDADLAYHSGSMTIKHAGRMLSCIHGAQLGVAPGSDSKRLLVSMYFKEDYIKQSTRMPDQVTQSQFFNYCDQNTGTFSATQSVAGADTYYVIAANPGAYGVERAPGGTLPSEGYKSGLTMAVKLDADLPSTNAAGNLAGIRFFMHHPNHENDESYGSVDYVVDGISDINGNVTSTQLDFTGQSTNEGKFELLSQSNVKATAVVDLDAVNGTTALSTNP